MVRGVAECHHFILIVGDDILGALIEVGIAIGVNLINGNKVISVICPEHARSSAFFCATGVNVYTSVEAFKEAYAKEG
jgi:hypothetical protein